ncbi:hypothetical protein J4402_00575 [Candidatus Pacearchaeota archaeon]|nr:hypothetical protein [Candidatus Pacearchaeota archaeon]
MKFKTIKINNLQFLLSGIVFIFLSAAVSAFAVGFQSDNLQLLPGEVYDSAFSLQNYGSGCTDITVEATLEEGGEYVTFPEGNRFDVSANSNAAVPIQIKIPTNAKVGDSYPVKILFKVVSGNVGGNEVESGGTSVAFAFSYRREINLNVVKAQPEETEKTKPGISAIAVILSLAIIAVIIIILWLVIKSKKQQPAQNKKR